MTPPEKQQIRQALQCAMDDLLEGRVPGPLTSLRLVELAGVKRHRLTHDNPDLNNAFQERARELNRTKPEVESVRMALRAEKQRNARLAAANRDLDKRLKAYANALLDVLAERDSLRDSLSRRETVISIPAPK
jgi:septal ring factor EnvC (AmiA/AmiB activator)